MEDDANMETYPAQETRGRNSNAPIPDDEYQPDSSTGEEHESVDTETATSEQAIEDQDAQDESVPFNQHPRWKEREQEWNAKLERLEREAEESRRLANQVIEKFQSPQQPVPPQEDPWRGLTDHPDPATAQWYQHQKAVTERTAERIAETKLSGVMQAVDAGRRELAAIKIAQFRKENPDIKQGSQEEAAVVSGLQQGYDLDTARKLALFDKYQREIQELKGKRSATPQKVAANNSERSSGIPNRSGLPNRQGDWRTKASETYDKSGGSALDVFNSVFGKKR